MNCHSTKTAPCNNVYGCMYVFERLNASWQVKATLCYCFQTLEQNHAHEANPTYDLLVWILIPRPFPSPTPSPPYLSSLLSLTLFSLAYMYIYLMTCFNSNYHICAGIPQLLCTCKIRIIILYNGIEAK